MPITQGTFSYLPEPRYDETAAQDAFDNDWPPAVEYTDDPHPRNS